MEAAIASLDVEMGHGSSSKAAGEDTVPTDGGELEEISHKLDAIMEALGVKE